MLTIDDLLRMCHGSYTFELMINISFLENQCLQPRLCQRNEMFYFFLHTLRSIESYGPVR